MTASSPNLTTVLFDLGGVLASDILDRTLFDRRFGLAPFGARRVIWKQAAGSLWDEFAVLPHADELAFWQAYSGRVGEDVSLAEARAAEAHILRVNHAASSIMPALREAGVRIGIVSDNTAFWYPRQMAMLKIQDFVDPKLTFLSFERRMKKLEGLYALAARHVNPAETLVVEDRQLLRDAAARAGFATLGYNFTGQTSLESALTRAGITLVRPALA